MTVAHLSDHVREAVEGERKVVAERLADLRIQADRLHVVVAEVDRNVEETMRLLRHMDEMLGLAPQLSLEALHGELRGQRLREIDPRARVGKTTISRAWRTRRRLVVRRPQRGYDRLGGRMVVPSVGSIRLIDGSGGIDSADSEMAARGYVPVVRRWR